MLNESRFLGTFRGHNRRTIVISFTTSEFFCGFSIKKVAAAACCLKEVLQKPAIITLMKQYEDVKIDHLFGYLEPFKPSKRVKVCFFFLNNDIIRTAGIVCLRWRAM